MNQDGLPGEGVGREAGCVCEGEFVWACGPEYRCYHHTRAVLDDALDEYYVARHSKDAVRFEEARKSVLAAALSSPETTPAPDAGPAIDRERLAAAFWEVNKADVWMADQVAAEYDRLALPQPGEPTCDFPLSDGRVCTRLAGHDGVHQ